MDEKRWSLAEFRQRLEERLRQQQTVSDEKRWQLPLLQWKQRVDNLRERFAREVEKPAVLVIGRTGVGKSSIINAVLAENLAQAGVGVPVTDSFDLYSHESLLFDLYDSPGLEGGDSKGQAFVDETKKLLRQYRKKIRLIWYVVDAQGARLTNFEVATLKALPGKRPIIFVFTKCDIASDEQLLGLMQASLEANIPNRTTAATVAVDPLHELTEDEVERFDHHNLIAKTIDMLELSDNQ